MCLMNGESDAGPQERVMEIAHQQGQSMPGQYDQPAGAMAFVEIDKAGRILSHNSEFSHLVPQASVGTPLAWVFGSDEPHVREALATGPHVLRLSLQVMGTVVPVAAEVGPSAVGGFVRLLDLRPERIAEDRRLKA